MNKPKENMNNDQAQKVEQFMNNYINNTQWKQFLLTASLKTLINQRNFETNYALAYI